MYLEGGSRGEQEETEGKREQGEGSREQGAGGSREQKSLTITAIFSKYLYVPEHDAGGSRGSREQEGTEGSVSRETGAEGRVAHHSSCIPPPSIYMCLNTVHQNNECSLESVKD